MELSALNSAKAMTAANTADDGKPGIAGDIAVLIEEDDSAEKQGHRGGDDQRNILPEHELHDFDQDVLHRGVRDAGRWAYGTILVEVWVWNEDVSKLIRPPGGYWLDPIFHRQMHDDIGNSVPNSHCPLCRLTDRSLENYIPPDPLAPGEGLPGAMWVELDKEPTSYTRPSLARMEGLSSRLLGMSNRKSGSNFKSTRKMHDIYTNQQIEHTDCNNQDSCRDNHNNILPQRKLAWRQLQAIASDPDQPWNPRLNLLATTGIGWAAAVGFDVHNARGLVVYMAREGVSWGRLHHPTNEDYLQSAATFIGAAYALRRPRQATVSQRKEELHDTMARVKQKIQIMGRIALSIKRGGKAAAIGTETDEKLSKVLSNRDDEDELARASLIRLLSGYDKEKGDAVGHGFSSTDNDEIDQVLLTRDLQGHCRLLSQKIQTTARKLSGGGIQPPPPFNWKQTFFTFTGVLITLLMITRTNVWIVQQWGADSSIVLGPFGALMTLLFGLSGAPASQPRNAFVGQTLSISIAIGISRLDMQAWVQQALAVAFSVAAMVKLGVTHPPAGAAALLFATGNFGWYNLAAVLVGNVIAIGSATLINDMNSERQYPTSWGVQTSMDHVLILTGLSAAPTKKKDR